MLMMLSGASFGASLETQNPKRPGAGASNWRPVEHWPPGSLCVSYGVAWLPSTPCLWLPPQTKPESLRAGAQCQPTAGQGGRERIDQQHNKLRQCLSSALEPLARTHQLQAGRGLRRQTEPAGVVPSLTSTAGILRAGLLSSS
jgi:hypothetical protein